MESVRSIWFDVVGDVVDDVAGCGFRNPRPRQADPKSGKRSF